MLCRYVKFDTFHPAVDLGLPVTRVISRVVLQKKLAEKAEELEGDGVLANDCHVVDYQEVGCWNPRVAGSTVDIAWSLPRQQVDNHLNVPNNAAGALSVMYVQPHIWTSIGIVLMFGKWVSLQSVCQKSGRKVVTAILEDGRRFEGDILIGADGIWSKVR
jgi:hypothetical protein